MIIQACYQCYTDCHADCNLGSMRCFGPGNDECCNFYDPHDRDVCLSVCSPERIVTDIFDCAGMYEYSVAIHTQCGILIRTGDMHGPPIAAFVHTDAVTNHLCKTYVPIIRGYKVCVFSGCCGMALRKCSLLPLGEYTCGCHFKH